MNTHDKTILKALNSTKQSDNSGFNPLTHLGTTSKYKYINASERKQIAKDWLKQNKELPFTDITSLLTSLYSSSSYDEKAIASYILQFHKQYRIQMDITLLNKWLNNLNGWAEIDTLCQSTFTDKELSSNWSNWKKLLTSFNKSSNISKRRASLVIIIKSTRDSDDLRFAKLAFKHIENLKHEKEILITKAVSWSLREMTKQHWEMVRDYLDKNKETLPKIAVRETEKKLKTGKK